MYAWGASSRLPSKRVLATQPLQTVDLDHWITSFLSGQNPEYRELPAWFSPADGGVSPARQGLLPQAVTSGTVMYTILHYARECKRFLLRVRVSDNARPQTHSRLATPRWPRIP